MIRELFIDMQTYYIYTCAGQSRITTHGSALHGCTNGSENVEIFSEAFHMELLIAIAYSGQVLI